MDTQNFVSISYVDVGIGHLFALAQGMAPNAFRPDGWENNGDGTEEEPERNFIGKI
jgi:hypothetical protein